MPRIILALLLVAIGFFGGNYFSEEKKKEVSEMSGLLSLSEYLLISVQSSYEHLPVIIEKFENNALEKCGFIKEIRNNLICFSSRWKNAVSTLSVNENVKNHLYTFSEKLGNCDIITQIKHLNSLSEFLKNEYERTSALSEKKIKSYRLLGMIFGAAAITVY